MARVSPAIGSLKSGSSAGKPLEPGLEGVELVHHIDGLLLVLLDLALHGVPRAMPGQPDQPGHDQADRQERAEQGPEHLTLGRGARRTGRGRPGLRGPRRGGGNAGRWLPGCLGGGNGAAGGPGEAAATAVGTAGKSAVPVLTSAVSLSFLATSLCMPASSEATASGYFWSRAKARRYGR